MVLNEALQVYYDSVEEAYVVFFYYDPRFWEPVATRRMR